MYVQEGERGRRGGGGYGKNKEGKNGNVHCPSQSNGLTLTPHLGPLDVWCPIWRSKGAPPGGVGRGSIWDPSLRQSPGRKTTRVGENAEPGDPRGSLLRDAGISWVGGASPRVSWAGPLSVARGCVTLCSLGGSGRRGRKIGATRAGGIASRSTSGDQSGATASVLVATETRATTRAGGLLARTTPGAPSGPVGSVWVPTDTRVAVWTGKDWAGRTTSALTGGSAKAATIRASAFPRVSPISLRPRCFLAHVEAS
nr:uncharacterized protein LOC133585330 [Nerophis lumbriciformis]